MLPASQAMYIGIGLLIIFQVGRSLSHSWWTYLAETTDKEDLADAITQQLLTRFYLLCFGFLLLTFRFGFLPDDFLAKFESSAVRSSGVIGVGTIIFVQALQTVAGRIAILAFFIAIVQAICMGSLKKYRLDSLLPATQHPSINPPASSPPRTASTV